LFGGRNEEREVKREWFRGRKVNAKVEEETYFVGDYGENERYG